MNSTCSRCGQQFTCGMIAGQKKCWCTRMPSTAIDPTIKSCLCSQCLGKNSQQTVSKKVTWRLLLSYVGANYHGWQCQGDLPTIESELKSALLKITKQNVCLTVAGRTDSGVNARSQTVSCTFESRLDSRKLVLALDSVLPPDIAVWRADEMPSDFNAKRQSVGKRYVYRVDYALAKDVFSNNQKWHCRQSFDVPKMQKAAKHFVGEHDFESFRSTTCDAAHARRYLWLVDVSQNANLIEIDIRGNAFCHNMIRIMAGTLIAVGKGKLKPQDIAKILKAKNRILAEQTAPAGGLTFEEVYYPDNLQDALLPATAKFPRYPVTKKSWGYSSSQIKIGQV